MSTPVFIFSRTSFRNSKASSSSFAAMLADRVQRALQEVLLLVTPGDLDRILEAEENAFAARSSGASLEQVLAVVDDLAVGHLVGLACPASTCASVLLPEPFGPMIACTPPASIVRFNPLRTSCP